MIFCSGEALVDMVPRLSTDDEKCFAPLAGGAIFNTAIALSRLGSKTGYFGGISNDLFGELLIDGLASSNVDTGYCSRSNRPTTLAFVNLIDGQAQYTFYDENSAGRMIEASDLPTLSDDVEAMFFGGISLVVEPCANIFEELMKRECQNRVTMMDPNIRPSFISDEGAYRERLNRMIAMCDIVKLSDEDMVWLMGAGSVEDLAQQILNMGPSLVFVTEGAKGAHGFSRNHAVFVASKKVSVVDTIGAGDTFNAGILNALDSEGMLRKASMADISESTIRAALSMGAASAAITVSRAGANPPWAHEL